MAKALFVSLVETYPQLSDPGRKRGAAALYNCTCGWWEVDTESARDVEFVLGVFEGKVVSAYRVAQGADWPKMDWVMEKGRRLPERKFVPGDELQDDEWLAVAWKPVRMYGPIRYLSVETNTKNRLVGLGPDPDGQ